MKAFTLIVCFLACSIAFFPIYTQEDVISKHSDSPSLAVQEKKWKIKDCFVANAVKDVVCLHGAIFNWDTLKIVSTIFPLYTLVRMFDDDIQKAFYHGHCLNECHKDLHQAPEWCARLAQYGIAIPVVVMFGSLFVGKTEDFRTTSWMFLLGMPFVVFGKDVFKKIRFDAARRPWCGKFSSEERALGGFPSGHMAESTYLTALYGMRFGVRAAGPLAVVSTFLGVTFLNCNRHYASQLIAGAGIGTIFALAANKVIEKKLAGIETVDVGMNIASNGSPAVSVGWHF